MSWNYRVIEIDGVRGMHEVYYYDPDDKVEFYTESPVRLLWEPSEDPQWILDKMKEALDKPVLTPKDFGEGT